MRDDDSGCPSRPKKRLRTHSPYRPNMSDPLAKTLEFLAADSRSEAEEILLSAIDLPHERTRKLAMTGVMKRGSQAGKAAVVQRYSSLEPALREVVEQFAPGLQHAIDDTIFRGNPSEQAAAVRLVVVAERFDHVPALLRLLPNGSRETVDWLLPDFRELMLKLFDRCRPLSESPQRGKLLTNATQIRTKTLAALGTLWPGIEDREVLETLWETILSLGGWESREVNDLLMESEDGIREAAWDILSASTNPGVMQLLCEAVSPAKPPARAIELIVIRSDPEFITHFLRHLPKSPTEQQRRNLKLIKSICWLDSPENQLDLVPTGLHTSLVALVEASGFSDDAKFAIHEWIIRHGSIDGRLAATEALTQRRDGTVKSVVFESLDSDDIEVQAWATSQLREQDVPNALPILLERLDSPVEEIREAARNELSSFDLQQVLETYDDIPRELRGKVGQLIQKIDPSTVARMNAELRNPIQRRRLRAIRAAFSLNLYLDVVPALLNLLDDKDVNIRRAAAGVLGHVPETSVVRGLHALLSDENAQVRETAAEALRTNAGLAQKSEVNKQTHD